jgi:hypothetical protein
MDDMFVSLDVPNALSRLRNLHSGTTGRLWCCRNCSVRSVSSIIDKFEAVHFLLYYCFSVDIRRLK